MLRPGFVPWPEDVAERYVAEGYWRGQPLGYWMWDWAERYGERTALVDGVNRVSYRMLAEHADNLAKEMRSLGLRNGDNILVQFPNTWEFVALFLACQRIGVAPVLALLAHREHELGFLADLANVRAIAVAGTWRGVDYQALAATVAKGRDCEVLVLGDDVHAGHRDLRAMLTTSGEVEAVKRELDGCAPSSREVALFLLSGGTTGKPKIISRTHDDYEYNARQSSSVCGFSRDTVYLVTLPAAHNFPLGSPGILGALIAGGRAVMLPSPTPEVAFPIIQEERVTVTSLVPAIARRWMEAASELPSDFTSLTAVQIGGSVLAPSFAARLGRVVGCTVQQVYGMAEGLLNYTRLEDPWEVTVHTQGRPISAADEVLIVDKQDRQVEPGASGELLTRGPYTPRGYFAAPDHNADAFTRGGWYRTGDIVRRHESGNLIVEGRVKDLINRGGEKISAAEVEALTKPLSQVREACAVPVPDNDLGERVCLCVQLNPGTTLTLQQVRNAFIEQGVARFKIPERLEVLDHIPVTAVGKYDKRALAELIRNNNPE